MRVVRALRACIPSSPRSFGANSPALWWIDYPHCPYYPQISDSIDEPDVDFFIRVLDRAKAQIADNAVAHAGQPPTELLRVHAPEAVELLDGFMQFGWRYLSPAMS